MTGQVMTPLMSGNYYVIVTQNGCSDTSNVIYYLLTDINDVSNKHINIYPNPATSYITIDNVKSTDIKILSDINGKMIDFINNKNIIDISDLSNGIYLLKIITEKEILIDKFIKE